MIELNPQTLTAPELLPGQTPESSVFSESDFSSDAGAPDFNDILLQMTGTAEAPEQTETSAEAAVPAAIPVVPVLPFVPLVSVAPLVANTALEIGTEQAVEPLENPKTPQTEMEKAWADVKKFEFTVEHEDEDGRSALRVPGRSSIEAARCRAGASPAAPAVVTSDPIANTKQQQMPLRVTPIQRMAADTEAAEQPAAPAEPALAAHEEQMPPRIEAIPKAVPGIQVSGRSSKASASCNAEDETPAAFSIHFSDAGKPAFERVEQVRPAHFVEIPNQPHLQVVRTVAMEVGDPGSEVVIRIQERDGGVSLQLNAGSELLRRDLQSSATLLVHALRRQEVQVSSVEVSRKSLDKVRRMKEAH